MSSSRIFAVDVETTGLDPRTSSIVSIGCVKINPHDINDEYYGECRPFDGAVIEKVALKVNGFTEEELQEKALTEAELLENFFSWLNQFDCLQPMMLAHNAGFDMSFIAMASERAGLKNPFGFRSLDVHSLMHMHCLKEDEKLPGTLSLNKSLEMLGFDKEPDPHNALTGAQCNARLYERLMDLD